VATEFGEYVDTRPNIGRGNNRNQGSRGEIEINRWDLDFFEGETDFPGKKIGTQSGLVKIPNDRKKYTP